MTLSTAEQAHPAKQEPSAGEVAVGVRSISKHFGHVVALDDVSLEIRRGEFFSLLGPSGCGKTTLLRLIGGFESADCGDIVIDGKSVAGLCAVSADDEHDLPASRALPAHERVRERGLRPEDEADGTGGGRGPHPERARAGPARGIRRPGHRAAERRAETARRHGPRAGQRPVSAASRRAAGGAGPPAPPATAGRAPPASIAHCGARSSSSRTIRARR